MAHFTTDKDDLYATVFAELKYMGIKVPKVKKFKSNILKQEKTVQPSTSRIFGVSLADQEWEAESDYVLPKFIVSSIAYLRQHTNKKGLFRKPGSISRLRELRVKLEKGDNIHGSEPNDVASLLKQWLRELPEPLIPQYMHDLFIRCQQLDNDENKITANLLTCLLLPPNHLYTLKYLLCFFADFAAHSNENLMGSYNLAMCVAPNIFVINDSADKTSTNLVHIHVSIIQLLIENATKIGSIPEFITLQDGKSCSELDSSGDFLESGCSKKKKQKNGHVQDLLSGIKKLVGQNSTSAANQKTPEKNWNSHVTAPRSASKREADTDIESVFPIKKQPKLSVDQENILQNLTPKDKGIMSFGTVGRSAGHIRKKSFGLLRKKERKRQKSCHGNPLPVVTFNVIPPENQTGETAKFNINVKAAEESVLPASENKSTKLSKSDSIKKSTSESYLTPKYGKQQRFSFSPKSSDVKFEISSYFLRPHKTNEKVEHSVEPTLFEDKKKDDVCKTVVLPENLKTQNIAIVTNSASEEKKSVGKGSINHEVSKESKLLDQSETPSLPNVQELKNGGACKRVSRKGTGNQVAGSRGKSDLGKRASSSELRSKCRNKSPQKNNKNSKTDLRSISDSQIKHGSHRPLRKSPKCDKFSHKGALSRNEAFIVKPKKQKENVLQHPVSASDDSTKVNKRTNPRRVRNENSLQKSQSMKIDVSDKNKVKSAAKRASRNGSLIRGRPNTVNTGLRCELRGNESILVSESSEKRKSQNMNKKNIFEENESCYPVETKKENTRGNESNFDASRSYEKKSLKLNKNEVEENVAVKMGKKNKMEKGSPAVTSQSHERRKSARLNRKNEVDEKDSCILPDQDKVSDQINTSLNMRFENFHLSSPIHSSETLIDFINNMFSLDDKSSSLDHSETQYLSVDQSGINTRLSADKSRRSSLQLKSDRSSSGSGSKIPRVKSFLENKRTGSFSATPEPKRKVSKNRESGSFSVTPEPKGKVSKNRGSDSFSVTPEPKGKVSMNRGSDSFSVTPEPKGKVSKNRGSDSSSLNSSKIPIKKPDKSFDISSLQVSLDDSCFKTPNNFPVSNSINWVSGSKYLGITSPEEDTYNKRESIALILRNNPGHVQAKVSMYDTRIRESVVCTRSVPTFSTPFERFDDGRDQRSSQKNHRKLHDSRSYDSAQNFNRRKNKTRSPFPLPPKFDITEAGTPSGSVFLPLNGEIVNKGNESRNSLKEVSFKDENCLSKKSSGIVNHPIKESTNATSLLNDSENSFNISIKDENNLSKRSMENVSHPLKEVTNISFEMKSPLVKDGYILSENVLSSGRRQKKPKRSSFNAKSPHKRFKKVSRSESSPGRPRPYDKTRGCMRNSSSRSASIIVERNNLK